MSPLRDQLSGADTNNSTHQRSSQTSTAQRRRRDELHSKTNRPRSGRYDGNDDGHFHKPTSHRQLRHERGYLQQGKGPEIDRAMRGGDAAQFFTRILDRA
jgi:hypothetical protein